MLTLACDADPAPDQVSDETAEVARLQNIKTDAAGAHSYDFGATIEAGAGFSVATLGPSETPLFPGDWREAARPAFFYEVVHPL